MDCLSAQSPFSLRKLCVWLVVHENILFYHAPPPALRILA